MTNESAAPWYRDRWPWLLISGPAIVVVAATFTAYLAVTTSDGLVADDYYKQGLGINRVIEREEHAQALGLAASVTFNPDGDRVRVLLSSAGGAPATLRLTLTHATRAGEDRSLVLVPLAAGLYEAQLRPPRLGTWRMQLEDGARSWRLAGDWRAGEARVTLVATAR